MNPAGNDAPLTSEEATLGSLRMALDVAISRAGGIESVSAAEGVISEFRTKIEDTIAWALSDRNGRASTARKIPRELWLQIWRYLPFGDMVSAARVCSSWRTLAHAAPELWTVVDIHSSLHHHDCDCWECEESLSRAGETNLGPAKQALSVLSGTKPVVVRLRCTRSQENSIFEGQLVRTIEQCATRLVELDITCNDGRLPSIVLNSAFPALERLTVKSIDSWGGGDPYSFVGTGIELPALVYLDLDPDCGWPDYAEPLQLPSLYRLSSTFHSQYELLKALAACSQSLDLLDLDLHWRLDPRAPGLFDVHPLLLGVLDTISTVQISNITAAHEARVLELFARRPRDFLWLQYIDSTIAHGLQACQHLDTEGGLRLDCMLVSGRLELSIGEESARHAIDISLPYSAGVNTDIDWHTVPEALTSIKVDAALWEDVIHGLPPAPRVAMIMLRVTDASCLDRVQRAGEVPPQTFAPTLSLILYALRAEATASVRLPRASVERVRRLLGATKVSFTGIVLEDV